MPLVLVSLFTWLMGSCPLELGLISSSLLLLELGEWKVVFTARTN